MFKQWPWHCKIQLMYENGKNIHVFLCIYVYVRSLWCLGSFEILLRNFMALHISMPWTNWCFSHFYLRKHPMMKTKWIIITVKCSKWIQIETAYNYYYIIRLSMQCQNDAKNDSFDSNFKIWYVECLSQSNCLLFIRFFCSFRLRFVFCLFVSFSTIFYLNKIVCVQILLATKRWIHYCYAWIHEELFFGSLFLFFFQPFCPYFFFFIVFICTLKSFFVYWIGWNNCLFESL